MVRKILIGLSMYRRRVDIRSLGLVLTIGVSALIWLFLRNNRARKLIRTLEKKPQSEASSQSDET